MRHVIPSDCCQDAIDGFYIKLVDALKHSADLHNVPAHYKNYYKFRWSQELSCLKENAIQSNEIWKAAGRRRTGPITDKRNADKRIYKKECLAVSAKQNCNATAMTYTMLLLANLV